MPHRARGEDKFVAEGYGIDRRFVDRHNLRIDYDEVRTSDLGEGRCHSTVRLRSALDATAHRQRRDSTGRAREVASRLRFGERALGRVRSFVPP